MVPTSSSLSAVEADGQNMYIANHACNVRDMPVEQGQAEIRDLIAHASQPKYVCAVSWHDPGDLGEYRCSSKMAEGASVS